MLQTAMVRFAFFLPVLSVLVSCTTRPPTIMNLDEALQSKKAITLPMRMSEEGLILLEDIKVGQQSYTFALDTGATQSAIFESALKASKLEMQPNSNTIVHGMITSEERETIKVPKLEVGPLTYIQKTLVILADRDLNFDYSEPFDGLIGMDVLSTYQIYISPKTSELKLIPNENPVSVSGSWDRIELIENPFKDDNRALHFIRVRVAGNNTPALLDTGAEFSVMNWNSAKYSQLKAMKRRLREKWELQGAVGTFKPVTKVTLESIRSGQKFWDYKDFLVMNFDSLDVLGVSDEPFLIVGMNLFKDETFLIDFERNYIAMKPTRRSFQTRFIEIQ